MFGWLNKKAEHARVSMCIKELKWSLESYSDLKVMKIWATAALLKNEMFGSDSLSEGVLNQPFDYPRNELMQLYSGMEDIRNNNEIQFKQLQKGMQRFEIEIPDFAKEQVEITRRATELWMVTIGAGVVPEKRDEVRKIWSLINDSKGSLSEAIEDLRRVELLTAEVTGFGDSGPHYFNEINTETWISICEFRPRALVASIEE